MSAGASGAARATMLESTLERRSGRTPLAQLLHALNQPLTGLQCSLEVTLASPRTNEQYTKALFDGLALTERMRLLVEAVREVAEILESEQENSRAGARGGDRTLSAAELRSVLGEAAEELRPVAEVKQVNITFAIPGTFSAPAYAAETRPSPVAQGIFRLLESVLSLAERGSVVRIEAVTELRTESNERNGGGFRIGWRVTEAEQTSALSRPELGLLAAQARLEHSGALWARERTAGNEVLTVLLPSGTADGDRRD